MEKKRLAMGIIIIALVIFASSIYISLHFYGVPPSNNIKESSALTGNPNGNVVLVIEANSETNGSGG